MRSFTYRCFTISSVAISGVATCLAMAKDSLKYASGPSTHRSMYFTE